MSTQAMRVASPPAGATSLRSRVRTMLAAGVDLLFPPACATCGKGGNRICPSCAQLVTPVPDTICMQCGRVQATRRATCAQCQAAGPSPLHRVRAAALHTTPLREWIHLLKYEDRPDLAPDLARYLAAALALPDWDGVRQSIDAVVPVPLHAQRRRERGYNQSELLAAALCRRSGLALAPDLLERQKETRAQVGLGALERQANVAGAFAARPAAAGRHILLIDDVYTTGATLRACAQALHEAGATQVSALTLALPDHNEAA